MDNWPWALLGSVIVGAGIVTAVVDKIQQTHRAGDDMTDRDWRWVGLGTAAIGLTIAGIWAAAGYLDVALRWSIGYAILSGGFALRVAWFVRQDHKGRSVVHLFEGEALTVHRRRLRNGGWVAWADWRGRVIERRGRQEHATLQAFWRALHEAVQTEKCSS